VSARARDGGAAADLTRAEYFARWSELHEGIDPAGVPFVRGWLTLAYSLGRPLAAAGVAPTALTVVGLVAAGAVAPLAGLGARWPLLGVVVVVASGLLDNLDGTVAVLANRVTNVGALADTVCDRLADAAYGLALWLLGAPAGLAVAWVGLSLLAEYVRVRGHELLGRTVDVVTVGERPTRIVLTAFALAGAGLLPDRAHPIATVVAVAAVGTALVGLVQIVVTVARRLR
jgi:CDP-diacylglycerol--glycerol-3-phosphate 3-phosphatidyltransferase